MTDADDDVARRLGAWLEVLDSSSYYELLGVLEIADDGAIQDAFRVFSQAFHPDQHRSADDDVRSQAAHIYKRGVEAYGVLRDPARRAEYDLALAKGQLRLGRAEREGVGAAQSLDDLCKTPAGRLHARRAERALSENNLEQAEQCLVAALSDEGENRQLAERLKAVRTLLRASGR